MLTQALHQFGARTINDQLQLAPLAAHAQRRPEVEFRRRLSKARANFLITLAGLVGFERQHGAAAIDDRELIDQSLEFGDEVGGDKNRAVARISFLVGADHRLNELTADDGIQTRRRLVQHQQVRLRADRRDQRHLRSLTFRESIGPLGRIKLETLEQLLLGLPVPALPE